MLIRNTLARLQYAIYAIAFAVILLDLFIWRP